MQTLKLQAKERLAAADVKRTAPEWSGMPVVYDAILSMCSLCHEWEIADDAVKALRNKKALVTKKEFLANCKTMCGELTDAMKGQYSAIKDMADGVK